MVNPHAGVGQSSQTETVQYAPAATALFGQKGRRERVLYSFCSQPNCTDSGGGGSGTLIMDAAGHIYGATLNGGANNQNGVVFEMTR
jgi:hypothetical protein